MLSPERQSRILQALAEAPAVRASELAGLFGVSDMTIRRDIELLDGQHLLKKIHGGASRIDVLSSIEPGFASKLDQQLEAKRSIAQNASRLIENGMTIVLGAGTTTVQLASQLAQFERLTVITNSIKAAEALYHSNPGRASVIITGGERTPSEALVGPLTMSTISSLHVDLCFLGAHGVHPRGLSSPNIPEAQTNSAFIEAASDLVVLADHSKFGVRALATFAPLEKISVLVTDQQISDETLETYGQLVKEMVVA